MSINREDLLTPKAAADLNSIIASVDKLDVEYKGKQMSVAEMEKYNNLLKEGADLSNAINEAKANAKTMERMRATSAYLGEVPNPTLPAIESKDVSDVVGYITAGDAVILSHKFQEWNENGRGFRTEKGISLDINASLLPVRGERKSGNGLIALRAHEVKELRDGIEKLGTQMQRKDLPVIGELVIAPNRVDRFVQDTRPEMLTLRDVLTVVPTSSPLIQYVAEVAFDNDAEIQSEGTTAETVGTKAESDIEYELRDATIKTVAHTLPVSEQQLSDAPALINRINSRLLHGVRQKEEQLCGYGTGSGLEWQGFFTSGGAAAYSTGDTVIDKIRGAQASIMTDNYMPSFVWIHPIDWADIELTKGSDGHYIWAIVRDNLGPRIWSMRVVQGTGTLQAGDTERNILVGDTMGAVLYDRQQANIAVGFVDDQFAKNMRTIRAEERVVLCIEAGKAFRKIVTVAE
jgi:HK97 family phage major capsid protein